MTRALRTDLVQKPRTLGERIRFARISGKLSQKQLADAIALITKTKVSKSLVSKWELDGVQNPNNATMLALQAVTGFAMPWIVSGRGPQRVELPTSKELAPLDPAKLSRALAAAAPRLALDYDTTARIACQLYDILTDTPEIAPAVLERFAATLRKA